MSYVRKFTRREKILSWLIDKLDTWQEKIAQKQWAKIEAKEWRESVGIVKRRRTKRTRHNEPS